MDTILKRAKEILDELITVKVCPSSKDVVSYGDYRKWNNYYTCFDTMYDDPVPYSQVKSALEFMSEYINSLKTPQFARLGAPDERYNWKFNQQMFGDNNVNIRYMNVYTANAGCTGDGDGGWINHPGITHVFDVAVRSCPFPMLTSFFKS